MFGIAHDRDSRVVGHIQPLVTVDGPGIGGIGTVEQMRIIRGGCSPEPEGAIDMNPRACVSRPRTDLFRGIEGARVDIASLNTDEGTLIELRQSLGTHAPL